jgi:predicted nucleic acid-binding protein
MNSSISGAVVVDANILVAISSKETATLSKAQTALSDYAKLGYRLYAPDVVVGETLFALCQKLQNGFLLGPAHAAAIVSLDALLKLLTPPPDGDTSLMLRAEQIRNGYGCSHSAEGLYIALAEQLSQSQPTTLLTLDVGLSKQATQNAPTVTVDLIVP